MGGGQEETQITNGCGRVAGERREEGGRQPGGRTVKRSDAGDWEGDWVGSSDARLVHRMD